MNANQTIKLFVILLRRNYALRRVKDAFKENKGLSQQDEVHKQYQFANENLNVIRRQVSSDFDKKRKYFEIVLNECSFFRIDDYWQAIQHRKISD